MQRDFLGPPYGIALHFVHDIRTAKVLATQHFFRCANLSSAAQFLLPWWSQIPTCNETVVLLSGEGDDLGVIFDVAIGCDGDLTAFDMCQLYAFRIQLSLDDLSRLISSKGHNSAEHWNGGHDRALTFAPGWHALVKRSRLN